LVVIKLKVHTVKKNKVEKSEWLFPITKRFVYLIQILINFTNLKTLKTV
jgi:hypothetical protein